MCKRLPGVGVPIISLPEKDRLVERGTGRLLELKSRYIGSFTGK
jgi:hypothetical protein